MKLRSIAVLAACAILFSACSGSSSVAPVAGGVSNASSRSSSPAKAATTVVRAAGAAVSAVPAVDFTPKDGPLEIASFDAQAAAAGLSDVARTYATNASNTIFEAGTQELGSLQTSKSFANSSTVVRFVAAAGATTYLDARVAGSASIGVYFNAGGGEAFDSFSGYRELGGINPGLLPGSTYFAKLDVQQVDATTTDVRLAFVTPDGSTAYSQSFVDTVPETQGVSGPDDVRLGSTAFGVEQFEAFPDVVSDSAVVAPESPSVMQPSPSPSSSSVPQGLYESCGMIWVPSTCLSDLDTFKAAGFTRVINYALLQTTASDLATYLSHAAADGIQVVVSVNSLYKYGGPGEPSIAATFPALSATCPSPCTTGSEFASYVASIARSNPGTWGYYIGDETDVSGANEFATGAIYVALKSVDPDHPTLFVGSEGFSTDLNTLTNLIQPFAPAADYLGADHYAIGAGDTTGAAELPVAQALHSLATTDGKPSVLVLQAYGFAEPEYNQDFCSPYPACGAFPTEAQMHTLYQNAIQGDPNVSMIFWYSWMDIQGSSNPAGNFANLQAAIRSD